MASEIMLHCYNKGCGKTYDPNQNSESSCVHHPGVPVFHDALKGWSCCKKRSTCFTEFLNIPGCTTGQHSNEKPEPVQPEVTSSKSNEPTLTESNVPTVVMGNDTEPEMKPIAKPMERPSEIDPKIRLQNTVGATLKNALERQMNQMKIDVDDNPAETETVQIGTSCKNSSCKQTYDGPHSNSESCVYHPGQPIFHEGMKYWTCCQRKTSDFDSFLNQEGCSTGSHLWSKKEDPAKTVACRHDWHQTGQFVTISIFSKVALPEQTWVEVNGVSVHAHVVFNSGESVFDKSFILQGVIDPARSNVKLLESKVEINLRKAEAGSWRRLELEQIANTEEDTVGPVQGWS